MDWLRQCQHFLGTLPARLLDLPMDWEPPQGLCHRSHCPVPACPHYPHLLLEVPRHLLAVVGSPKPTLACPRCPILLLRPVLVPVLAKPTLLLQGLRFEGQNHLVVCLRAQALQESCLPVALGQLAAFQVR